MNQEEDSLIGHIEALRSTLVKSLSALFAVLIPCLFLSPKVLNYAVDILISNKDIVFNYFSPVEVFLLQIKIAFFIDFAICFPYILLKIWDFISPALYENEKKVIIPIVISSSLLFVFGALFCAYIVLPLIINFGISFATNQIKAVFGISNVISMCLWLMLAFGLLFQTPLISNILIRTGIVSKKSLSDKRPYVVVIMLIMAAMLTPPDIVSQLLLFMPAYLLFELGLLFAPNDKT